MDMKRTLEILRWKAFADGRITSCVALPNTWPANGTSASLEQFYVHQSVCANLHTPCLLRRLTVGRKACYADPAMNTPTKPLDGYRAQGVALWKASEEWIGTSHGGLQTSKIWFIFASKGYLKLQDLVT